MFPRVNTFLPLASNVGVRWDLSICNNLFISFPSGANPYFLSRSFIADISFSVPDIPLSGNCFNLSLTNFCPGPFVAAFAFLASAVRTRSFLISLTSSLPLLLLSSIALLIFSTGIPALLLDGFLGST